MSVSQRPALPSRAKGVQSPSAPALPLRNRTGTPIVVEQPTLPPKPLSDRPKVPPRLPSRQNVPALPTRPQAYTPKTTPASRICGRTKPPKYENRDYMVVDEYVRSLPNYSNTRELSYALTCNFDDLVERLRAILAWVAFNIQYDADSFLNKRVPPQSASNTLQTKLAVCSGYSQLFQELCNHSNIKSIEINGASKGFGFDPSCRKRESTHAWNAVYVDNEWRMIDSTWAAGHIDTSFHFRFNPFYFLTDPDEFIYDHMPMDETLQFTTNKYSWDQYFALNQLKGDFFSSQAQLLDHIDCGSMIKAQQGEEITVSLLIPKDLVVRSGLNVEGQRDCSITTRTRSAKTDRFLCTLRARCPLPGTFILNAFVFPKHGDTRSSSGQLLSMNVVVEARRDGVREDIPGYPQVYGSTLDDCSIVSPLISPLPVRTTHEFSLEDLAPDARTRTLPLCLWVAGQKGPELQKKMDGDKIIYTVRKHLTALGDVSIAVRNGNSFNFLAKWEVA